jgi:hypothetical protein
VSSSKLPFTAAAAAVPAAAEAASA